MKKYVVRTFAALAVMTLAVSATVFANDAPTEAPLTPILTVVVETDGGPDCDYEEQRAKYDELRGRIAFANWLMTPEWTVVSEDGLDVPYHPVNPWWAPQLAFDNLRAAVNAAMLVRPSATVAAGQEIEVTIGIAQNPGFAGMVMRFDIPDGLEIVDFNDAPLATADGDFSPLPLGGFNVTSPLPTREAPLTQRLYAGWLGRRLDLTGNGDLFSFTLRVTDAAVAGTTAEVTMTFANAWNSGRYEIPTNAVQQDMAITFPDGNRNIRRVADGDVEGRSYTVTSVTFR